MEAAQNWSRGPDSSVGIRISLQFNFLQTLTLLHTEEMLVASGLGPGHRFSLPGGTGPPSCLMHPSCCTASPVGPVVLEPLYTTVGAGPGICWDLASSAVLLLG